VFDPVIVVDIDCRILLSIPNMQIKVCMEINKHAEMLKEFIGQRAAS